MKRILTIIMTLCILMSLCACGGGSSKGGKLVTGTCSHCHGAGVTKYGNECGWCNGTGFWAFYN